ncbi:hypothetical protein [Paenibacillus sp. P22]|uniref:hypothetical protein n=1 Tax=Paenibacillus sp. P22 TaxID=483908 RepID=UPI00038F3E0B|nr:hypothetical protein [Paenibacillus sp. P22]CDN41663.1 hypothetical protein BN871_AJ_00150 [Paenibacillus sp. P22]
MDIRTMPAGPELDAELARALGYKAITEQEDLQRRQQTDHAQGVVVRYGNRYVVRKPSGQSIDWQPSATWEGAGQVIEEMRRRGWDYILQSLDSGGHGARFDKWDVGLNRYVASVAEESESAPHAITIAAILALRSEADNGDVR